MFIKNKNLLIFLHLVTITIFILAILFAITGNKYIYGARVDWVNQHSVLPEYFRMQFYNTGKLIPDFAMNLGSGQNIFNFAYHGFLSPFTLVSYLLPMVPMRTYVMVTSLLAILASAYLFYYWLRKNGFTHNATFVSTFLFTAATPLLFHSHKQVMFVDYMPFLIMALIGVDQIYARRRKSLLIISIFLMFLTSYFFSVSALFMLTIYAIYKYLSVVKRCTFKNFIQYALPYCSSIITGIMLSALLLFPSFVSLMSGRTDKSASNTNMLNLLIPEFPLTTLMYSSYGVGLTAISVLSIVAFIIYGKKKERIFLGVSIICFTCIPLLMYLLNGLLYARSKALIPFVPLIILMIAYFIKDMRDQKYSLKPLVYSIPIIILLALLSFDFPLAYILGFAFDLVIMLVFIYIYYKNSNAFFLYLPPIIIAGIVCIVANFQDDLLDKKYFKELYADDKWDVIQEVLDNDDSFYRSNDLVETKSTNNMIYHPNFNQTGCYSSAFNRHYVHLCNYDLNLANPTVNDISLTNTNDIFFQTLMGVKYILTTYKAPVGYELVKTQANYNVYKNENVYSLGFATNNLMGLDEFKMLSPEDKQLALLKYIVVDKDLPNVYSSPLQPVNLAIDMKSLFDKDTDGFYHVNQKKENKKLVLETDTTLNDDIYVVNTKIKQRERKRATIRINGIQNSLSGRNNAYPNNNFNFKFVVSDAHPCNKLNLTIVEGDYRLSDFSSSKVSYDTVKEMGQSLDMMTDIEIESDNIIKGSINVKSDGYFTATIPYDKGFTIYVDGKKQDYQLTDNSFIGFEISAGKHDIVFEYTAPLAKEGRIVSLIGLLILIFIIYTDFFRKNDLNMQNKCSAPILK